MSPNLKSKINEFLSDRKYSNNLIDILSYLDEPLKVKPNILLGIQRLFVEVLRKQTMYIEKSTNDKSLSSEDKYKIWLRDCYNACYTKLLNVLSDGESDSQIQALATSMQLLQMEGKHPINPFKHFPEEKLTLIIKHIVSSPFCPIFIEKIKEFLEFKDIVFYSFKSLSILLSNQKKIYQDEATLINVMNFIKEIALPNNKTKLFLSEIPNEDYFCSKKDIVFDINDFCKFSTNIWNVLSNFEDHNSVSVKPLLMILIDKLMFYHTNPILITDFLMNTLNFKGPIAVLALQGMVNLVREYNLEYPNIYDKLYNLLEPNIFYTKYKARLFYLTDLLMMSTHLPESLVAAFIKRLARLCLTAPPQDIAIMIYLMSNLIMRHKGLMILYEKDDEIVLENDPFNENEANPYNTNALQSSLWELKILQNHPLYTVNVPARFINNPLPSVEWDLGKYLEVTYDEIFNKEFKKKQKNISVTFERPDSMFIPSRDNTLFSQFSIL